MHMARDYSAPALEKGIDIIELLADSESALPISEIALRLKRRMSELFRIIVVMERRGWLQKDPETARYSVSYHVLKLAHPSDERVTGDLQGHRHILTTQMRISVGLWPMFSLPP